MFKRNPHHRRRPQGQVVAGAAVVMGLAVSIGLLLAGDGPDMRTEAASASAAMCSVWTLPSVVF